MNQYCDENIPTEDVNKNATGKNLTFQKNKFLYWTIIFTNFSYVQAWSRKSSIFYKLTLTKMKIC